MKRGPADAKQNVFEMSALPLYFNWNLNPEIIGIPTTVSWALIFEREDKMPRHPAQLYEAIAYLLLLRLWG
jgi:hypothetical protein